jgi:pimeloyl-ACP methyl ester carboxylesterase
LWPGTAHRFLTWRIARHDMKVERERQQGPREGGHQATQMLNVAGEGIALDRILGANSQGPMQWALAERSMSDLAAFIEAGAALNAYDSSGWLPQLDVPSAVLITAGDTVVAPWRQEGMAALIPGAQRFRVEGGHDAVVAQPDVFLPILRDACAAVAQGN